MASGKALTRAAPAPESKMKKHERWPPTGWAEAVLSAVKRKERRQAFEALDPSYQARLKHQREMKAKWVRRKRKGKV